MDAAERREAVKRRLQAKAETQSKRDAIYKSLENQRLAEMNKALGGKQMMTGTMKCPPDAKPGSKRMCKLPDGREIEVEIPPYAKEGVEFSFGFEAPADLQPHPLEDHDGRFLEKELEVPEGKAAGECMCVLALPWKQDLPIKVPEQLKAGDKFTVKVPVPRGFGKPRVFEHTIQVPEGKGPGAKCDFKLPWGETLSLTVPDGAKVGDNLKIEVPFPANWSPPEGTKKVEQTITIPDGALPGEKIVLTLPWGVTHEIIVPEGASSGDQIKVVLDQPVSFTQSITFSDPVEMPSDSEETKEDVSMAGSGAGKE